MSKIVHVDGEQLETAEITVRLGARALEHLRRRWIACSKVWLTEQPDGTFALGVVTDAPTQELFDARAVETELPGARPFGDGGEAGAVEVALAPTVDADPVVVERDGELANALAAHAATRTSASPANTAAIAPTTETSA